ncbi:MerR family transcriptional regulator [Palleronia abyssalis]|uniref:HTH-type transcriptional regulator ZntR n=1 Tax=Palleronia abyssalis TaxID=1501240 RepID=A0A2R8BU27_9RHOB|nr:MerR family DNA-binding transcriptional regulator [Palleronia abyssalis]SPJ23633.1 HTH-type transcriptional regulator ZntR [Palleronia abyssalis]
MPQDDRLTFKEMCAKFDVTPRTLRYYEYIELLTPVREGRARFYTPRDVARMTLILRGRRWGFSLEDIRQWLLIYDQKGTEAQMRTWVEYADRQIVHLTDELAQLEQAIAELRDTRDEVAQTLELTQGND